MNTKTILLRDVPEDLHTKLRIAALNAHISMNQFIIESIKYTLSQMKKEEK